MTGNTHRNLARRVEAVIDAELHDSCSNSGAARLRRTIEHARRKLGLAPLDLHIVRTETEAGIVYVVRSSTPERAPS